MIIYGSGYFNRRDYSHVRGSCQHCGTSGYLHSYTSTHFITLYFIPVFPIGKKKIIEECPSCKEAMGMSFGKFKSFRKKDLPNAVTEYEANPLDAEAAEKAIAAATHAQDKPALKRIAPQIQAAFKEDKRLLALLAQSCSYLCLDDLAGDIYLEAIKSEDEEIAASADWHTKQTSKAKPAVPNRFLQSLPVFIVPAIILFFLSSFLQKSISNKPEDVFLVNGLDQAYQVNINGETITLSPRQRTRARMVEFTGNTISPVPGSLPIEEGAFDVSDTTFAGRAFDSSFTIINPDKSAIINWERTLYSELPVENDGFDYKIHTGKLVHIFKKVDYKFRDFPDEITLPSGRSSAYKTRIEFWDSMSSQDILSALMNNGLIEETRAYTAAALKFTKDDRAIIALGSKLLDQEVFLETAQPYLDERPANIEWHRTYQSLQQANGIDITEEYRNFYKASPDDSAIAYLYGRTITSPSKSLEILEKAANASNPTGYAANALSYHYLLKGEFESALNYSDRALEILPDAQQFENMKNLTLFGLQDHAAIEKTARRKLVLEKFDADSAFDLIYALSAQGKQTEAETTLDNYMRSLQIEYAMDPSDLIDTRLYYEVAISIATHDAKAYAAITDDAIGTFWEFQNAILHNRIDNANTLLTNEPDTFSVEDRLLLYTLALNSEEPSIAANILPQIVEALSSGSSDSQLWAKWLSGEEIPDIEVAAHSCNDLETQCLYLAALSRTLDTNKEELAQRAGAIVNKRSFHSLVLANALGIGAN